MRRCGSILMAATLLAGCTAAGTSPSPSTSIATANQTPIASVVSSGSPWVTSTPSPDRTAVPPPKPTPHATEKATPKPTVAACPSLPVTIDEIARLTPERALACFGGALLTFEAYVPPHPYGIDEGRDYGLSPAWLNGLGGSVVALSAGPDADILVLANVPPALGRCDSWQSIPECPFRIFEGHHVLVSARFDDPVARTCRAVSSVEGSTFTDAEAVAECRRLLIVLSVGTGDPSASAAVVAEAGSAGERPARHAPSATCRPAGVPPPGVA